MEGVTIFMANKQNVLSDFSTEEGRQAHIQRKLEKRAGRKAEEPVDENTGSVIKEESPTEKLINEVVEAVIETEAVEDKEEAE